MQRQQSGSFAHRFNAQAGRDPGAWLIDSNAQRIVDNACHGIWLLSPTVMVIRFSPSLLQAIAENVCRLDTL